MSDNADNERVQTTNPTLKKNNFAPTRCHKLPRFVTYKANPLTMAVPMLKKIKLKLDAEVFEKPSEELVESFSEEIVQVEDEVEETFEVCEYAEEDQSMVEEDQSMAEAEQSMEPMDQPIQEETHFDVVEERTEVVRCNQETQTDPVVPDEPAQPPESKDDKLISILYPEFKGMNKIQLIDLVSEKNRKIESLEEKVKKLELAMRNLL